MSRDPIKIEMWKDKTLIKVMKVLKKPENENWLKNALIILLSLFDDNPANLYSNRGNNMKRLSNKNKEQVISKLREEFFSE